jgi:hypothetical protein
MAEASETRMVVNDYGDLVEVAVVRPTPVDCYGIEIDVCHLDNECAVESLGAGQEEVA